MNKRYKEKEERKKGKKRLIFILLLILLCIIAGGGYAAYKLNYYYYNEYEVTLEVPSEEKITLEYGEKYQSVEASAMAYGKVWNKEGIEIPVKCEGDVDDTKIGQYKLTYTASFMDAAQTKERFIEIIDTKKPEIELLGDEEISMKSGQDFDDPGARASDNYDGNLTNKIKVIGKVDTNTDGIYELTYRIEDSSGNSNEVSRTVRIYTPPSYKVVYLTFDDGPGPLTENLLNLLDKYNVKATFFVVGTKPAYQYLIKEEARRGHTVAIHSLTHEYYTIYESKKAFFEDLDAMNEIIKEETGEYADILRFPGGSGNSICEDSVRNEIIEELNERGIRYCDWNVSTGDGGNMVTTEDVFNNATTGMLNHAVSIILQHDSKQMSMDAVEEIIKFGLDNGYTFLPMDETTEMVQQRTLKY